MMGLCMKSLRSMIGMSEELKPTLKNPADKAKFSGAAFARVLDLGERQFPKKHWPNSKLYASGLGYVSIPEFVLQYFDHQALPPKVFPASVGQAMEVGTAVHEYIQSRLLVAGCIHPQQQGPKYDEPRFECERYRIVAKVDGLISEDQIAELGATKPLINNEPRPLKLDLLEIKVLNNHRYKNTKEWPDISREYRLQATATQKISGYERTLFMIVDRDSLNARFIVYRAEDHLWDFITQMSDTIFTHLRELSRPEGFLDDWLTVNGVRMGWDQWVQYHINRQPKRKWLHLENSSEDDGPIEDGGFIIA